MSEEYVEYYAPFHFKAYAHSLSRGYPIIHSVDKVIPDAYKNPDHLIILCHACESYMLYKNDAGTRMDGYYICPNCGKRVREETLYRQLQRDDLEDDERERRKREKRALESDNDWD